jgi:tRNA(Ile)-lysidine synthase
MNTATKVDQFVKDNRLLRPKERVLVAYSGGPDSTALMLLLQDLGYRVSGVYVNHGLRGDESEREEVFVREFCRQRRIPLFVEHLAWGKKPPNLEEQARKKRYRHLAKVAQEHGFRKVALGHHRDDVAETFLLRLLRGSGPRGLSGIPAKRGDYIRPLLDCSRAEILHYLEQKQASCFHDTSNKDLTLQRNRIRHEILPLLERHFNPELKAALHRTSRWILEQNRLLAELMKPHLKLIQTRKNTVRIQKSKYLLLPVPLQKVVLHAALEKMDPTLRVSSRTRETLLKTVKKGKNLELPGFLMVESTRDWIQVRLKTGSVGFYELDIPGAGTYFFPPGSVHLKFTPSRKISFEKRTDFAFLDAERVSFPLLVRNWKKGDTFRPLGMKGHKKLSDLLIDRKVPQAERKRIPLVFKEEELVWVAGHQISDDFRVTDATRKVLRIELKHV